MSAIQAELARRERATRRSAVEAELALLQQSFHQRLAGDRSAGPLAVDLSPIRYASFGRGGHEGDFSSASAVADGDDVLRKTPRQRVYAAERRYERRLETQAREELGAIKIQALIRGRQARKDTHAKMARKRDVRPASLPRVDQLSRWDRALSTAATCGLCHAVSLTVRYIPMRVQAYNVHVFGGRFVEERVLRDAGLLDSARKPDSTRR